MSSTPHTVPQRETCDAVIVGPSVAGGWAARERSGNGLDPPALKQGRHVEYGKNHVTECMPPQEFDVQGQGDKERYAENCEIQRTCCAFGEATEHFFVNDKKNPYVQEEPFAGFGAIISTGDRSPKGISAIGGAISTLRPTPAMATASTSQADWGRDLSEDVSGVDLEHRLYDSGPWKRRPAVGAKCVSVNTPTTRKRTRGAFRSAGSTAPLARTRIRYRGLWPRGSSTMPGAAGCKEVEPYGNEDAVKETTRDDL
ncbi:MAG: hypothetical protein ABEL04_05880 [Salinibacter sp.]|uniref:hypothetical protein n=1 Tax=Salinibacter sp. TaxID=2065818 RepID=UPI0035D3E1B1